MFYLKFLSKENHSTVQKIADEITTHPTHPYAIKCGEYDFSKIELEQLLGANCSVCVQRMDNFSKSDLEELINIGQAKVNLHPKDFSKSELLNYLNKGASMVISIDDGFDLPQIRKMVLEGGANVFILGKDLSERDLSDLINDGASVILKKEDGLSAHRLTRLAELGGERVKIYCKGLSSSRVKIILEKGALVTLGKMTNDTARIIKALVKKFKSQISLEKALFRDEAWMKKMEELGAIVV